MPFGGRAAAATALAAHACSCPHHPQTHVLPLLPPLPKAAHQQQQQQHGVPLPLFVCGVMCCRGCGHATGTTLCRLSATSTSLPMPGASGSSACMLVCLGGLVGGGGGFL